MIISPKSALKSICVIILLDFALGQAQPCYAQMHTGDRFEPPSSVIPSYREPDQFQPLASFQNQENAALESDLTPNIMRALFDEPLNCQDKGPVIEENDKEQAAPDARTAISNMIEECISGKTDVKELQRIIEYDLEKQKIFIELFNTKYRSNEQVPKSMSQLCQRCIDLTSGNLSDSLTMKDRITVLIMKLGEECNQDNGIATESFEKLLSLGDAVIPHALKAIAYGNDNAKKWAMRILGIFQEENEELTLATFEIVKEIYSKTGRVTPEDWAEGIKKSGIIDFIEALDVLILDDALKSLTTGKRLAVYILSKTLKENSGFVRIKAADALVKIGAPAVPALINTLKDEDRFMRAAAADALGGIGEAAKDAVPALIEALRDGYWDVHIRAVKALGRIGEPAKAAVPALINTLKDEDRFMSAAAVKALGRIGEAAKDAVPALIEALKDESADVRRNAAEALGGIGEAAKDAVPALIEALRDGDLDVRIKAVEALGKIGDPRTIEPLEKLLETETNTYVKTEVREAIAKIKKSMQEKK